MNIDSAIQVTGDGSRTARSSRYAQTYHSTFGAVTEARHVYLDATDISRRLHEQRDTRVLEIGFGLGLNALLTADLNLSLAPECRAHLSYHAFEHDLIDASYFEALEYDAVLHHPQLAGNVASLLRTIDACRSTAPSPVPHGASHWATLAPGCELILHLEDATASDCGFFTANHNSFHAIYLDAFCPETNAECWTPAFIARLADTLCGDGYLSTYSAKGDVRRAMLAAGLRVQKLPGPPGKREILLAHR